MPPLAALSLHRRELTPETNHSHSQHESDTPSTVTLLNESTPLQPDPFISQGSSSSSNSKDATFTARENSSMTVLADSPRAECQSHGPGRIPTTHSLDDALRYWDLGDPARGLNVPLKKWSATYAPEQYRSEAQKLSMIEKVRDEFVVHCGGDMARFNERFPGLRGKYTNLLLAVRAARKERGDTRSRNRK